MIFLIVELIEEIKADKEEMGRYLKQYPTLFDRLNRYFTTLWTNPDLVR